MHQWSASKKAALILFALIQLGDFATTALAMTVHGVVELNPLLKNSGGSADLGRVILAKAFVIVLSVILLKRAKTLRRMWITCGLCSAMVISNSVLFLTHL
ncbi:MAG: hypothetical protein WAL85_00940 [Candidatus Korobacteraceae bacterium]